MQLYFVKATYSKNVYKIGDFFLNGAYKLVANKLLNINSRIPNEGVSFFITKNLILDDTTDIRDHTHVIVPEYNKIYKITDSQYINAQQYRLNLEEDALIGNYVALSTTDIILSRTNDTDLFRGQNDVSDLALKQTVATKVISSATKTGKWALIFMQIDSDINKYGLKFKGFTQTKSFEQISSLAALISKYPEVETTTPELYDYYQNQYIALVTQHYINVYMLLVELTNCYGWNGMKALRLLMKCGSMSMMHMVLNLYCQILKML